MSRRETLHAVYVLHRRNYRDSSFLVEVFSRDHGRLGVVARGARRRRSPWPAMLQPFYPLLLSWSGRGELKTVTDVEPNGGLSRLAAPVIFSGLYINELLIKLLAREDPHPRLFDCYDETVAQLAGLSAESSMAMQEQRILRIFEKRLLEELGYRLLLDEEAGSGRPVEAQAVYLYRTHSGPVPLPDDTPGDAEQGIRGRSLQAFSREQLDDWESLRAAKRITRAALAAALSEGHRRLSSGRLRRAFREHGRSCRGFSTVDSS